MARRSQRTKKAGLTVSIGQKGVNLVETQILNMGFVWNPTYQDSGIDGIIEIVETATRTATNRIIQVQVKATSQQFQSETTTALSFSCDAADIDYWLNGNAPVILIVCRPLTLDIYWKDIKAYFLDPKNKKTNTVRFDKKTDKLDGSAAQLLANLAHPRGGLHLGPLPKKETLISNLFPVEAFPETIWSASSRFRTRESFGEALKGLPRGNAHLREFVLNGDTVYSFLDLTKDPLTSLVEPGTIETNPSQDWAITQDPDLKRRFVQLLNQCLRQYCFEQKIAFNAAKTLFYFMWESKGDGRSIRAKSLQNTGTQSVAEWHASKLEGGEGFFRHKAFHGDFVRYGSQWYLEITPTYFFTSDGRMEYWNSETLLSGIKRLDRHQAVRGHVLLWRSIFTERDLTKRYDKIRFGLPLEFEVGAGIEDDAWKKAGVIEIQSEEDDDLVDQDGEDEDSNQTLLW